MLPPGLLRLTLNKVITQCNIPLLLHSRRFINTQMLSDKILALIILIQTMGHSFRQGFYYGKVCRESHERSKLGLVRQAVFVSLWKDSGSCLTVNQETTGSRWI